MARIDPARIDRIRAMEKITKNTMFSREAPVKLRVPGEASHFECDHCGDVAIESRDGMFTDGDGGECASCGMPGQVSMDAETDPYWSTSQEEGDRCNRKDCEDCADIPLPAAPPQLSGG